MNNDEHVTQMYHVPLAVDSSHIFLLATDSKLSHQDKAHYQDRVYHPAES